MTFSRCRIYPSLFLFLFLLALAVIPASARDLSQHKQESASSQPVQNNEDPLKRPLKAHEHKSLQGKEGKHCRAWEKDVRVIMTDEELSAFRKIKENAEQVGAGDGRLTLGKRLALAELEAGEYQLTVKVTDLILGQTITSAARFAVE